MFEKQTTVSVSTHHTVFILFWRPYPLRVHVALVSAVAAVNYFINTSLVDNRQLVIIRGFLVCANVHLTGQYPANR